MYFLEILKNFFFLTRIKPIFIQFSKLGFSLKDLIGKESLILPSNYFYPYPNFMLNKQNDKYKEIEDISIGIHHWEMSWMKGNIFNRIQNKFKVYFNLN